MEKISGLITPVIVYLFIFLLNLILPGRWVKGYITRKDSGEKMNYHLNGLQVFFIVVATFLVLSYFKLITVDWFYRYRWYSAAGAFAIGLVFSAAFIIPYQPVKKSVLADFYLGRVENLQLSGGRVDVKMWLYLAGATMLGLNIISFTAYHIQVFGSGYSPGIMLSALLMIFFLVDYLTFEEVHLYTYDLFAERIGFKLGWGCLVFYAYFYSIFLWSTVDKPDAATSPLLLAIYILVFLSGWVLSRGANLQKYFFKKNPSKPFLGISPRAITDGNKALLVNGFWGVSRHINYLGEILMATGMILCTGHPGMIWPWLYPLYYVGLLFTRQADDDRRCRAKYGDLWDEYRKQVPYKIIPFIY